MKIVGLTGGIATGKSTVSKIFKEKGFPIVDADEIAHRIILPGQRAYDQIVAEFGRDILEEPSKRNSPIVRKRLGAKVFGDETARLKLNSITHSAISTEMLKTLFLLFIQGHNVAILDVPLLFEAKMERICSSVIVVYVNEETQKKRLLLRDGSEPEYADNQIKSQMPLQQKCKRANWVIDNSGDLTGTREQVLEIVESISPSTLGKVFSARNVMIFMLLVSLTAVTRQMLHPRL